jgi:hypothetical protein
MKNPRIFLIVNRTKNKMMSKTGCSLKRAGEKYFVDAGTADWV